MASDGGSTWLIIAALAAVGIVAAGSGTLVAARRRSQ
jgi:hypothetical protein